MLKFRRRRASLAADGLLPDAAVESALRAAGRRGGRVLAWLVVVASPLVMLAGLIVLRPSTPTSGDPRVQAVQSSPQGWAEMYVRAWLSASRSDSAGLEAFYPPGMKTQRAVGTQVPVDTATLSTSSPAPGIWSIAVAVTMLTQQPDGKHQSRVTCVQVSVAEAESEVVGPGGRAYVAVALPAPVTCPATLAAADLAYPETAELDGPIGQSVLGFLSAYLTGHGDLNRYTAPDTGLAPVSPSLYAAVQLVELCTHERFEPGQAARPLDRAQTHVMARAWGYDSTGEFTVIDYALTLTARAGRWEVSQIDPAPLLAAAFSAASEPPIPSGAGG